MTEAATLDGYGVTTGLSSLRIERLLPGPIERVWAYLTDSRLRGQWLATGEMDLRVGGRMELIWRNDELTAHKEARPEGAASEHRIESVITRIDPPRLLAFGWEGAGDVTFELEPRGSSVLLAITHRNLPNRSVMLGVSAGWHAHLDILDAVAADRAPAPFWSNWQRLRGDYDQRLPQ